MLYLSGSCQNHHIVGQRIITNPRGHHAALQRVAVPLFHGFIEQGLGANGTRSQNFIMLFQFGRKIDGRANHRDFQSVTIADGTKVKRPGMLTRQVIAQHVDEIVTVDDNAIAEAIVVLLERTRTIGEGAGVVGLAALMQGKIALRPDDKVVVVISGGNVDMTLVGRSIDYGLASSGRLMCVAVTTTDAPGQLLGLLKTVAALGMNVRHVEHRRGELHVPVGMTEVILQMETRDFEHQRALLTHFSSEGLRVRNLVGGS